MTSDSYFERLMILYSSVFELIPYGLAGSWNFALFDGDAFENCTLFGVGAPDERGLQAPEGLTQLLLEPTIDEFSGRKVRPFAILVAP